MVLMVFILAALSMNIVQAQTASNKTSIQSSSLSMPLRYQWNENNGYCGECSIIATGLTFGQYFSQYDARIIADNMKPTSSPQTRTQFLIGVNDEYSAQQMKLNYISWNNRNRDTNAFLLWMKQMWFQGYPVTFGVYTNEYLFYGKTDTSAGDSEYDHIVYVTDIKTSHADLTTYYADDVLYFSDNALWNPKNSVSTAQYIFSSTFKDIQGNRQQANAKTGAVYTLCNDAKVGNYGIAFTGVADPARDTLPVRVDVNVTFESPEVKPRSNDRPQPAALSLTVTVSGLSPGVQYVLYKYNNESAVPTAAFNKNEAKAVKRWTFGGNGANGVSASTYVVTENILSSDKAIFRAVRSDAP